MKGSLIIYQHFNDDAPAFLDVIGRDRERAILVEHTSATPQHEDRSQPKDFVLRFHARDYIVRGSWR